MIQASCCPEHRSLCHRRRSKRRPRIPAGILAAFPSLPDTPGLPAQLPEDFATSCMGSSGSPAAQACSRVTAAIAAERPPLASRRRTGIAPIS
jgi:hypothetical protein